MLSLPGTPPSPINITQFNRKIVAGHISDDSDRPIQIYLILDGLTVASNWGIPDRSNRRQLFRFNLSSIWRYTDRRSAMSIQAGGFSARLSPIDYPEKKEDSFDDLAKKLANGHIFNEKGRLQLSKTIDIKWQASMLAFYNDLRSVLSSIGIDLIIMYGTLLGARRSGTFIGHDHDFDAAYISKHTDPKSVCSELVDISYLLSLRGYRISCKTTCIWVTDKHRDVTIDIFHLYFDKAGKLQFPFGVTGTKPFMKDQFNGYNEIELAKRSVLSVANADPLLEYIYGPNWKIPNPGFNWDLDRTEYDRFGRPNQSQNSSIYWTDYYLNTKVFYSSEFAERISQSRYLRRSIIDMGCGNGRDVIRFMSNQSAVIGVDKSATAIAAAKELTVTRPRGSALTLLCGDLCNTEFFLELVEQARQIAGKGGVTFYGRFLLHAIEETEQERLILNIASAARKGDTVAFEFRTKQDESLGKAHPFHGRRFIDPITTVSLLEKDQKFTIVEKQEGTGFSYYLNENPHLCRLIAARQ